MLQRRQLRHNITLKIAQGGDFCEPWFSKIFMHSTPDKLLLSSKNLTWLCSTYVWTVSKALRVLQIFFFLPDPQNNLISQSVFPHLDERTEAYLSGCRQEGRNPAVTTKTTKTGVCRSGILLCLSEGTKQPLMVTSEAFCRRLHSTDEVTSKCDYASPHCWCLYE